MIGAGDTPRLNLAKDGAHASRRAHTPSREGIEKLALIRVIRVHPSNYIASRPIENPVPLASLINLLINTSDQLTPFLLFLSLSSRRSLVYQYSYRVELIMRVITPAHPPRVLLTCIYMFA